ncbi:uncharacterized protein LOC129792040 [Lutzomyia longipalpis]|uniref:uncharacterized protein LOC129792040 n=1 Tax=Lutzomyia longipalpis TaxID=7200 RepID=UPI002483603C|nr:uncharacterized protein LOC129792040 [Lutzomyia longipalpis]
METHYEETRENSQNLRPYKAAFSDLPLMDLMPIIAQYLRPKDLFALRCTSHYCKQAVDDVGFSHLGIVDVTDCGCGWKESRYYDIKTETVNARIAIKKGIMEKCRKARKFKIDEKWLTNDLIHEFLKNNPSLEELELIECSPIANQALQPLLNCKNLVSLKMRDTQCGTDEFLRNLSQHNNHLLEIDLDDRDLQTPYTPEGIKDFISKQPHLKYICLPYVDDQELNNEIITTIVDVCKDLESIKLAGWRKCDDRPLIWLGEGCNKLKHISLGDLNWREDREIIVYMTAKRINFSWGGGSNCLLDIEGYIFHLYSDSEPDTEDEY